ncbi:hypothetical protein L1987_80261 [Smallanthus sonchifolius]|uniref:Uncharacterized protein n=1 Tax=Smallanthus sonchifolius TaxID=185202 RepID=A0ACB8YMU4_9ASTR|nr:hypothetical protein L1987_80261 [Smallanthus sonchifolius]
MGGNAADFYPERFENVDVDYGWGSCDLIPFGGGRRSCPAIKTAPETVEAVIANLLYWFDWELPDGVKNDDLDMYVSFVISNMSCFTTSSFHDATNNVFRISDFFPFAVLCLITPPLVALVGEGFGAIPLSFLHT